MLVLAAVMALFAALLALQIANGRAGQLPPSKGQSITGAGQR